MTNIIYNIRRIGILLPDITVQTMPKKRHRTTISFIIRKFEPKHGDIWIHKNGYLLYSFQMRKKWCKLQYVIALANIFFKQRFLKLDLSKFMRIDIQKIWGMIIFQKSEHLRGFSLMRKEEVLFEYCSCKVMLIRTIPFS